MKDLKFLADVNIEKLIVTKLRELEYDVSWVTEIDIYLPDNEILAMANAEKRVLLTNDKDFGEIVFRQRLNTTGVILLRIKEQDEKVKLELLLKLLQTQKEKVENHFIVVTPEKFRIVALEGRER